MANKADLAEKRSVSKEQIEEFAVRNGLMYLGECSALNNQMIKEHVEALITRVH